MEKGSFKYEKYSYDYFLLRDESKCISLTVKPDLTIIVKCPQNHSQQKIDAFLKKNMKKIVDYTIKLKNLNEETI